MEHIKKKKKKNTNATSSLCSTTIIHKKEKEIERNKANEEFIKTSSRMSKDELDAANESSDQKTKKRIKDITDPTSGLFIDDQLKPNEQNFQNTTDKIFNLPPQVQEHFNNTVFKKNHKTTYNSTSSARSYSKY